MGAILPLAAEPEIDMLDPDIPKRLQQQLVVSALGTEPTEEEISTVMKAMVNLKARGADDLPVKLLRLGLQQDRTYHPYLAREKLSPGIKRRGHYCNSKGGHQGGGMKLPRHFAFVTRG